jgi:hypothetical protein
MKDGGPAFPVPAELCQDLTVQEQRGMTLRDYFAAKAMQGMLANDTECGPEQVPIIVASAYILADAMIQERSKT